MKRLDVVGAWIRETAVRLGRPTLSILDYGCGTGDQLTVPLAERGHSVLGVDMHGPSIEEARIRHSVPSLTFRTAKIGTLVDERHRFDVVICSEVLEHVDDPGSFLAQLRALTIPDGAVIITTPNGYGSFELLCGVERWMRKTGLHRALRSVVWSARGATAWLRGVPPPSRPLEHLASDESAGFLNFASGHVQFFRLSRLERLFRSAGLVVAGRRARTLLCGPYVDVLFALAPMNHALLRLNNRAADLLPLGFAADWMFVLRPDRR